MPNSFANAIQLTCPDCGNNFDVELWLIVDVNERPDLLARVRAGILHDFPCPHCDHDGRVDAPLLIYHPNDAPHLIFSPAEETSEDEDVDQVTFLLDMLRDNLGPAWRDEWWQEVPILPRQMLPAALSDDPEATRRSAEQFKTQDQRNP